MNSSTIIWTIVVCSLYFDYGLCFIPFVPTVISGVSAAIGMGICRFKECCTDDYIPADLNAIRSSLKSELFNQHLALETVHFALKSHIENENPKKALVLSFQGPSGTGKNHMVNLIVESLYKKGADSNFVHYYSGHLDFSSGEKVSYHQRRIQDEVTKHLELCPRSIFIFDDVDHMPKGVLDTLAPFLDYNPRILKVNPSQAIFIFISNIGSVLLEEKLIEMWQAGMKREETKLQDFESLLANSAFNDPGGFHQSDTIEFNFIDHHIPFLPFEKAHVKQCIVDAFKKQNVEPSEDMIQEVVTHMTFGSHDLFSKSGCKRIHPKVATLIERQKYTNPKKNSQGTSTSHPSNNS